MTQSPTLPEDRPTGRGKDAPVTAGQVIEILETELAPIRLQVRDLHQMIMGFALPDGSTKGGMGQAFHDINNNLMTVKGTTEQLVAEFSGSGERRPLSERIAETVANKVLVIYQSEMRSLRAENVALVERLSLLEGRDERTP